MRHGERFVEPCSVLLAVEQLRRAVPGGIGTYARGLLGGLAALQVDDGSEPAVEVTLYASRATPDPLEGLGRPIRTSPLSSRLLTRAWDLGIARAPSGFDVVHGVSLASPATARRHGGALVVMVHDLAWRAHPEATTARGARWHEAALRRAIARSDALVVPSRAVAADLVASGAAPEAVRIIAEGADHMAPPDPEAARTILVAAGVTGPYLLAVGTLEPRKNLARLIEAFGLARPALPEAMTLVVAGPIGWGRSGLGERHDGVVAVGPLEGPALSGLFAGAEAFVYVPLVEGFGLPPLEAMAFGVPVVASVAVPSVIEVEGDPPARLVDPLDPEAIAHGLRAVVGDRAVAASLRQAGLALVATRTWRATAAAHVALWRELR